MAEMVTALQQKREPLHSIEQDIHLLEVIESSVQAAGEKKAIAVFRTALAVSVSSTSGR